MSKVWVERNKAARIRRERLFSKSRPFVRPLDMTKDSWVLWAAYDLGSFPYWKPDPLKEGKFKEPAEFFEHFKQAITGKSSVLMIDDDTSISPTKAAFKDKTGPVCMVTIINFGWRIEPYFDFFYWATPRMRLRAVVAFLQMVRHAKEVGVCLVRVIEKGLVLAEHCRPYEVLQPCGKIPFGVPEGDEYLYYVKGRKGEKLMKVVEARAA